MLPLRQLSEFNDDGAVYNNYTEDTIDPGCILLIVAVAICTSSLLGLPLCVKIGRICFPKCKPGREPNAKGRRSNHRVFDMHALDNSHTVDPHLSRTKWWQRTSLLALRFVLERGVRRRKRGVFVGENASRRTVIVSRGVARQAQESLRIAKHGRCFNASLRESGEEYLSPVQVNDDEPRTPGMPKDEESNYQPPHVGSSSPKNAQTQKLPSPSGKIIDQAGMMPVQRRAVRFSQTWRSITKYDNETKRIVQLIVPFALSAIIYTISELITLCLISHSLGTDSMVAFIMVDGIVGVTSSFNGGWIDAISSIGSMAYGAENYHLVGEYVWTASLIFVFCEIPMAFMWGTQIGKFVLWMGFDESVVVLAQSYVWVQVAMNVVSGVNQGFFDFLEVIEKERYTTLMYSIAAIADVGLIAIFALKADMSLIVFGTDATLVVFGLVMLANQVLFFVIGLLIPYMSGWLASFSQVSFAINASVLKQLFKTALPLSFGGILAYAEWEMLIVFAAFLGPAEAATWAILGFLWDVFESITGAIGDAAEVRCAFQLGKGRPALAKLSAYKSMFLAFVASILATGIFLCLSSYIPTWLTRDPTIDAMLSELFPMIALGNVTMTMGMVSWSLLGGQGRYGMATSIATGCSLLITLPLSALLSMGLRIDLEGLAFSVVIGYAVTAMLISTVLLLSDWEMFSKKIQDKMAAEEDCSTDDESDESSGCNADVDGIQLQKYYGVGADHGVGDDGGCINAC